MGTQAEEGQRQWQVIVPLKEPKKIKGRWIDAVSYPPSGRSLYMRDEAIEVLRAFKRSLVRAQALGQVEEPHAEKHPCYAIVGEECRFTLEMIDHGIVLGGSDDGQEDEAISVRGVGRNG